MEKHNFCEGKVDAKHQVSSLFGEKILFWKDKWIGEYQLAKQFLAMFKCAMVKEANVKSYFGKSTKKEVIWSPIF